MRFSRLRTFCLVLALASAASAIDPPPTVEQAKAAHWSYQPVTQPALPPVQDNEWSQTPVDRFILAALEAKGMTPSPAADRRTLIRRVTFDLLGLPPTFEQVQAFVSDPAPDAYENLVSRLLDSPHYGQRWGRHWLDVARYADTMGYNFVSDARYPFAWTYRDYVIDAFNTDKPYDRFITEQIAADRLDTGGDRRPLAAMGFITVGRRFDFDVHSTIDDRIDVVTRGLMGMTVACARCHDHKYDAIPTADYYALYGVFRSCTEPEAGDLPVIGEPKPSSQYDKFLADLAAVQKELEDYYAKLHEKVVAEAKARAGEYLAAVAGTLPNTVEVRPALVARFRVELHKAGNPPSPTPQQVAAIAEAVSKLSRDEAKAAIKRDETNKVTELRSKTHALYVESPGAPARAMVVQDTAALFDPYIFKRGQAASPGEKVPRRFLSVLGSAVGDQPFKDGSGRLDLAKAITHPGNPLTARVLVNRLWQHHFGEGLVRTPSDFGARGEPPSHPQLLDYLARSFLDSGGSIKKLHRQIVLSATYTQSSLDRPGYEKLDAENRLLWRRVRSRLELEPMRDAILFVSGQLDRKMGGRGVELLVPPYANSRSVYGYVNRQFLPDTYRTFDFASPDASCPARPNTTVPQQSLFFMNAPFIADQTWFLLRRKELTGIADNRSHIQQLYRIVFSRDPSTDETELGLRFIAQEEAAYTENQLPPWHKYIQSLLLSNEFVFVD